MLRTLWTTVRWLVGSQVHYRYAILSKSCSMLYCVLSVYYCVTQTPLALRLEWTSFSETASLYKVLSNPVTKLRLERPQAVQLEQTSGLADLECAWINLKSLWFHIHH